MSLGGFAAGRDSKQCPREAAGPRQPATPVSGARDADTMWRLISRSDCPRQGRPGSRCAWTSLTSRNRLRGARLRTWTKLLLGAAPLLMFARARCLPEEFMVPLSLVGIGDRESRDGFIERLPLAKVAADCKLLDAAGVSANRRPAAPFAELNRVGGAECVQDGLELYIAKLTHVEVTTGFAGAPSQEPCHSPIALSGGRESPVAPCFENNVAFAGIGLRTLRPRPLPPEGTADLRRSAIKRRSPGRSVPTLPTPTTLLMAMSSNWKRSHHVRTAAGSPDTGRKACGDSRIEGLSPPPNCAAGGGRLSAGYRWITRLPPPSQ